MPPGILQAKSLAALPGIRHAFFTREGGVSQGIYASLNGGGREGGARGAWGGRAGRTGGVAAAVGAASEALLSAYQIHAPDVVVAERPWGPDARPRADAIVTCVPGLAIGISTADCGPVLFADAQARIIAAAHAGWRGALAGVTDATIAAMERLGAERNRIIAALGPMIHQASYEVGADLVDRFDAADPANRRFFRPSA